MPTLDRIYKDMYTENKNSFESFPLKNNNKKINEPTPSAALQKLYTLFESYKYQIEDQPIYDKLYKFIISIKTGENLAAASFELDQAVRNFESQIHVEFSKKYFKEKDKAIIRAVQVELGLKENKQTVIEKKTSLFKDTMHQLMWTAPKLVNEMKSFIKAVENGESRLELQEESSYLSQAMKKYKSMLPNQNSIDQFNRQYRDSIRGLQDELGLRPRHPR